MLPLPSLKLAAGLAFLSLSALTTQAQDAGALVDKLIKKGILTDQEGEEVRADMMRDFSQTNAGKINLSSSVSELKLYGDFRYRYQYDERTPQVDNGSNVSQRSRHRFRLRLNADVTLTESLFAGFGLTTGQNADSDNQTFEDGFDDYNVFISKAFVGWSPNDWFTAVLGKQKNPFYTTDLVWDADINPNGLTESIAFHKMALFGGAGGPGGDSSKEGAVVADSAVRSAPAWELYLVAGQFIFDDNNEFNVDSDLNTDAYLFVEQLLATWKFNAHTSVTVAPGFMTFTSADLTNLRNENAFSDAGNIGATTSSRTTSSTVLTTTDTTNAAGITSRVTQPTTVTSIVTTVTNPDGTQTIATDAVTTRAGAASPAVVVGNIGRAPGSVVTNAATVASASAATPAALNRGGLPAVSGETRQLHILTAPGDISFKIGELKTKVYWDFAYNLGGRKRFEDIYQLYNPAALGDPGTRYRERDGIAWLVGLQLGETKKKGDWQAYINYRETGIAAVDPNLNDSDFAGSELNTRGFKLGLAYALADAVVLNVTGYLSWDLRENLVGGRATNAPAIAQDDAYKAVQVDLNVKF